MILPVFLYSEMVLQMCAPRTSPQCRNVFDCPQAFLSLDCQFRDNVVELKQTFGIEKSWQHCVRSTSEGTGWSPGSGQCRIWPTGTSPHACTPHCVRRCWFITCVHPAALSAKQATHRRLIVIVQQLMQSMAKRSSCPCFLAMHQGCAFSSPTLNCS